MTGDLFDHVFDILLVLFPFIAILLGGAVMWSEVQRHQFGKRVRDWPTVTGTIIRSEVGQRTETRHTGGNPESKTGGTRRVTLYHPVVEYRYAVDRTEYTNDAIGISGLSTNRSAPARKTVDRFPVGSRVPVYHDPDNPRNSLLDPDYHPSGWLLPLISATFMIVGFVWIIVVYVIRK